MTDSISRSIYQSIAAHVALVLLLAVRGYFAPSDVIQLPESIRVDIVGLPEKNQTLQPPKPIAETPPAKQAAAKPQPKPKQAEAPKVNLNPKKQDVKKAEKSALEKIHEMSALDRIKGDVAKSHPIKGNRVNAGGSLTGLEKIEYDRYFADIEQKVRENWSLPQWLVDAGLRAQALVLIDPSGMVKKKSVLKSSGNQEFDDQMMQAIDKSAPFPAPPDRLRDWLGIKGIVFNFPQRGDT